jgi:hypothetical protein
MGSPTTDLDGHPRPSPAGSQPDIGAYEHDRDNALAVTMLGFEAVPAGSGIALTWRTASERDNRFFELSRRVSNGEWSLLTTIVAQGSAATGAAYRFIDNDVTAGVAYSYRLVAVDVGGTRTEAGEIDGVSPGHNVTATDFELLPNYPNPFNSTTVFTWLAPSAAHIRLVLFNSLGERMAVVFDGPCHAGMNTVRFDANRLPTGVYFSRLEADARLVATHKLLLLK